MKPTEEEIRNAKTHQLLLWLKDARGGHCSAWLDETTAFSLVYELRHQEGYDFVLSHGSVEWRAWLGRGEVSVEAEGAAVATAIARAYLLAKLYGA